MPEMIISDRRASRPEVASRRDEIRRRVNMCGLDHARLGDDGTVIVHAPNPGYGAVARFAAEAANIVGTYVHVITDDVPAAQSDAPAL